jgi:hypothetical protein
VFRVSDVARDLLEGGKKAFMAIFGGEVCRVAIIGDYGACADWEFMDFDGEVEVAVF